MWHLHIVWWGNQDAGFPAQKSKSLGQGMQTLPSNIQVYTAGGGYHHDTIRTISLVDFACPKIENGRQEYLFWVGKINLCFEPMFDQRSSKIIVQNGQRKERLQHPSVCIGTGKQLLRRANGSLRTEAFGRLKFVYENGGLWLFPIRAIFYNCFLVLFRSNTKNTRLEHDLNMFQPSTSKSCCE